MEPGPDSGRLPQAANGWRSGEGSQRAPRRIACHVSWQWDKSSIQLRKGLVSKNVPFFFFKKPIIVAAFSVFVKLCLKKERKRCEKSEESMRRMNVYFVGLELPSPFFVCLFVLFAS